MEWNKMLEQKVAYVEEVLCRYLPKPAEGYEKITEAMEYNLMAGGKRLRPVMMMEIYHMLGGNEDAVVEPFMAALEMIHTYSLVHDDLPAMDNDDYRRGRKTTHIVYGEDIAILTGDALLNHAFSVVSQALLNRKDENKEGMIKALAVLAQKPSVHGMIGGQVLDLSLEGEEAEDTEDRLGRILKMYELKTSALLECAMMCGGYLANAAEEQIRILETAAKKIGLAFQIRDDILDIISSTDELGKPVGSDEKNQKLTVVSVIGVEKAQEMVVSYSEEAVTLLHQLPGEKEFFLELVSYLLERKK